MAGIFISCFPIFPPNMSGIFGLGMLCKWNIGGDDILLK